MVRSRRVTPKGSRPDGYEELPTLRQRNPLTFWVLILLAASLVAGPVLGIVVMIASG